MGLRLVINLGFDNILYNELLLDLCLHRLCNIGDSRCIGLILFDEGLIHSLLITKLINIYIIWHFNCCLPSLFFCSALSLCATLCHTSVGMFMSISIFDFCLAIISPLFTPGSPSLCSIFASIALRSVLLAPMGRIFYLAPDLCFLLKTILLCV